MLVDVHDLVTKCSFTTTSYVPSATNSGNGTTPAMVSVSGAPMTTASGATTSSGTGSGTDRQSATMTSNTDSAPQDTGAAAAIGVDGLLGVLVGVAGVAGYL